MGEGEGRGMEEEGASPQIFWHRTAPVLISFKTSCRPGGGETICPPPTAVRLAADLRPSAGGSAARTWLSCRQPECL